LRDDTTRFEAVADSFSLMYDYSFAAFLLSEEDKQYYIELRRYVSDSLCKNCRNRSKQVFTVILEIIRRFVMRNDRDDAFRAEACGIYWFRDKIAVNTPRLMALTHRSKSLINASLCRMGFNLILSRSETEHGLVAVFPHLRCDPAKLRQWTIRQRNRDPPIRYIIPKIHLEANIRLNDEAPSADLPIQPGSLSDGAS
jgi:hypothetical protein